MGILWRDLRYAVRVLRSTPAFTAIAVLTLAIGIGSTTTLFSVVNAVVLQPLPYPDAHELVAVRTEMTDGRQTTGGMSPFALTRLNEGSNTFRGFSGAYRFEVAIRDLGDRPLKTAAYIVTQGWFDVAAKPMAVGRGFLPEEHTPDFAGGAAVLSHSLWQNAFEGDPGIVGRAVPSGTGSMTVVGVAAADFDYPVGADVWIAFRPDPNQTGFFLQGLARLADGASLAQGEAELGAMARRFEEESASFRSRTIVAEGLQEHIVGDTRATLLILLGAAATLLLIACVNVMNLLLARGTARTREVALRAALGAGHWRIVRQLVTESMVLAFVGAAIGVVGSAASLRILEVVGPADLPRAGEIGMDGTVLVFALAATVGTGLVFGLLPALRLVASDIRSLMGGSARGSSGGATTRRIFTGLVVAQTAMAVTLVVAAGLLVRSYQRMQGADLGFVRSDAVVMDVNLPGSIYPDFREVARIYEELVNEVADLPGVVAVGATSTVPLHEHLDFFLSTWVEGEDTGDEPERARFRQVTPGFFEAMGMEMVAGRSLESTDRLEGAGVAVVNQAFVNRFLDGGPALGRVVANSGAFRSPANPLGRQTHESFEIVGVVADVRYLAVDEPGEASVYVAQDQVPFRRMFVTARASDVERGVLISSMRERFHAKDRTLPVEFTTLDAVVDNALARERLAMLLLLAFGLSAGALAVVGLYGVISYSVQQRTTEMAIRAALGATPGTVFGLSAGRGVVLTFSGVAVGVVAAVLTRRVLATQLYETSATDPLIMVGAPLALFLVAAVAVGVPALRAARANVSGVLRAE